ncbi:hypothetical protein EGM70_02010 [Enterobacteriaceae bacterium 89]|nr:hypothetical protein [Enterobacteriaceae bacterium 89]
MGIAKNVLAITMIGLFVVSASSFAKESEWQKHHPRRDEVNNRLEHQDQRIKHDVKDGSMSRDEAKNLHEQDRGIRDQERADAKADHGHITKQEKKQLNQEENNVSHEISTN